MKRSTNNPKLVQLRMPAELGTKIDDWRRLQPDIPTRSEAIRRLVVRGLNGID